MSSEIQEPGEECHSDRDNSRRELVVLINTPTTSYGYLALKLIKGRAIEASKFLNSRCAHTRVSERHKSTTVFLLDIIYLSLYFSTRSVNGSIKVEEEGEQKRKKRGLTCSFYVFISRHVFRTISKSNVEGGTFVLHSVRVALRLFAFVSPVLV